MQAELVAAVRILACGDLGPGMHEIPDTDRRAIASIWLDHYNR
ncbi:hypothetical protein [Streptomyces sp. NBC_00249]|nr:hypothetical protein [Streptomyces sp. NBC_00249]